MRRIVLLVMVAFLVAGAAALWASTYEAAEEMGDLTNGLPLTIASAVSISASSLTHLAHVSTPYTSECSGPTAQLCPLPLDRIEFS